MARGFKFRIKEVEGLYYLCSKSKGADQLCGYMPFVFMYVKSSFFRDQLIFQLNFLIKDTLVGQEGEMSSRKSKPNTKV